MIHSAFVWVMDVLAAARQGGFGRGPLAGNALSYRPAGTHTTAGRAWLAAGEVEKLVAIWTGWSRQVHAGLNKGNPPLFCTSRDWIVSDTALPAPAAGHSF